MRAVTPSMDVASSFGSYSSQELDQCLSKRGLELDPSKDNHVRWSPNSPHHPRHWRNTRKAYNVCFIGLYEAFEAGMTTVGASAAYQARRELGCSATVSYLVFTTLMLVGEGISGVVCPPLSESFGRKSQYVISCAFFCIFTGLSAIPSVAGIGISRFLAGLVGGVVPSISPGSIEDLVSPEHQGWAIFSWITASNIGLVMAPILSSYISEALGWYVVSRASALTFS